jgi:hypothetical protein
VAYWVAKISAWAMAVVGILVGLLALAYDGYTEDFGSPAVQTLAFALPWLGACAGLVVLFVAAEIRRSDSLLIWAVFAEAAMATFLVVYFALNAT